MITEALYNERVGMFTDAMNHREPKHIPIILMAASWWIGYAGKTGEDVVGNPASELECFAKAYHDIYMDSAFTLFLNSDPRQTPPLGTETYHYGRDGVSLVARSHTTMTAEEYPDLINDTKNFVFSKSLYDRYPNLSLPYPQNADALKESFKYQLEMIAKIPANIRLAKEDYGIPPFTSGVYVNAFDCLMDYFRGLNEIFADLRRRPEMVIEACEALQPYVFENYFGNKPRTEFPFILMPVHAPGYITAKQFEKFYLPTLKKTLDDIYKTGAKVFMALEGDWVHTMDYLNDFPRDFIIGQIENTDIFKAKDVIGKRLGLAGGMPLSMLRYATKQECIDHAKKVIDYCAPGGGYIFCTDKPALATNDFDVDNLIAVHDFVHNCR